MRYDRELTISWMTSNQSDGAFEGHPEEDMNFSQLSDEELIWYFDEWIVPNLDEDSISELENREIVVYELYKSEIETPLKTDYYQGITQDSSLTTNVEAEILGKFTDQQEAFEALRKYQCTSTKKEGFNNRYKFHEEIYLETNIYDQNGEWLQLEDIHYAPYKMDRDIFLDKITDLNPQVEITNDYLGSQETHYLYYFKDKNQDIEEFIGIKESDLEDWLGRPLDSEDIPEIEDYWKCIPFSEAMDELLEKVNESYKNEFQFSLPIDYKTYSLQAESIETGKTTIEQMQDYLDKKGVDATFVPIETIKNELKKWEENKKSANPGQMLSVEDGRFVIVDNENNEFFMEDFDNLSNALMYLNGMSLDEIYNFKNDKNPEYIEMQDSLKEKKMKPEEIKRIDLLFDFTQEINESLNTDGEFINQEAFEWWNELADAFETIEEEQEKFSKFEYDGDLEDYYDQESLHKEGLNKFKEEIHNINELEDYKYKAKNIKDGILSKETIMKELLENKNQKESIIAKVENHKKKEKQESTKEKPTKKNHLEL